MESYLRNLNDLNKYDKLIKGYLSSTDVKNNILLDGFKAYLDKWVKNYNNTKTPIKSSWLHLNNMIIADDIYEIGNKYTKCSLFKIIRKISEYLKRKRIPYRIIIKNAKKADIYLKSSLHIALEITGNKVDRKYRKCSKNKMFNKMIISK